MTETERTERAYRIYRVSSDGVETLIGTVKDIAELGRVAEEDMYANGLEEMYYRTQRIEVDE